MTLIAVHRLPRSAVFLSDTRLTETVTDPSDGTERKVQGDEVAKFIDANNRVRLFCAGPVSFWQEAADEIALVTDQITLENAAEMNGPLHIAIGGLAAGRPRTKPVGPGTTDKPPADAGALGFVLDTDTEGSRVVSIKATFGLGAEIEEVGPDESRLIGSGSHLAGLRDRFRETAAWVTQLPIFNEDSPDPLATLFNVLRQSVLTTFKDAGPGAHAQFNTGSVFVGGVLLDDWSCLIGEELYEFSSSSGASVYTLTRDEDGLVVQSGDMAARLAPLSEASVHVTQAPVDPQHREKELGLQDQFSKSAVIYEVIQWSKEAARFAGLVLDGVDHGAGVRKMLGGEARVFRSVYRIDKETRERVVLASRQTDVLTSEGVRQYPDVQRHYFEINDELQSRFERDVADHAFDHDWWRGFMPDYDGLLFSTPGDVGSEPTASTP